MRGPHERGGASQEGWRRIIKMTTVMRGKKWNKRTGSAGGKMSSYLHHGSIHTLPTLLKGELVTQCS